MIGYWSHDLGSHFSMKASKRNEVAITRAKWYFRELIMCMFLTWEILWYVCLMMEKVQKIGIHLCLGGTGKLSCKSGHWGTWEGYNMQTKGRTRRRVRRPTLAEGKGRIEWYRPRLFGSFAVAKLSIFSYLLLFSLKPGKPRMRSGEEGLESWKENNH